RGGVILMSFDSSYCPITAQTETVVWIFQLPQSHFQSRVRDRHTHSDGGPPFFAFADLDYPQIRHQQASNPSCASTSNPCFLSRSATTLTCAEVSELSSLPSC